MDEYMEKVIAKLHDESHQESAHKCTDGLRFLLTVSVSLLTLLLPLAIFLAEKAYNHFLLAGVTVALTLSCLLSLTGLIVDVRKGNCKLDHLKSLLAHAKGKEAFPGKEYKSPMAMLLMLAMLSGICFALAVLFLCGSLFQIFFSS